jgi:hypothetical protein
MTYELLERARAATVEMVRREAFGMNTLGADYETMKATIFRMNSLIKEIEHIDKMIGEQTEFTFEEGNR